MTKRFHVIFILLVLLGLSLRLPNLAQRPMHTDEAVHAVKFGSLLEHNDYKYDPFEYHGPTLNYFTLIPAWLSGKSTFIEISETTMRIVPLFFGMLLIFLLLPFSKELGQLTILLAGLLTAFSPAFVYFSRYYIMEILLVVFTFGLILCGYKFFQTNKLSYAILTGINLGLMHATKETFIIPLAAIFFAVLLTWLFNKNRNYIWFKKLSIKSIGIFLGSAIIVSVLLFSSLFTNWHGVWDSIATYSTYLHRADDPNAHIYPWYHYLKLITFFKIENGPIFSESIIPLFSLLGIAAAIKPHKNFKGDKNLVRFFAFFTIFLTLFYSMIPYKTPWIAMCFLHPMIILAGFGMWNFYQIVNKKIATIIVILGFTGLGYSSYLANFKYDASPTNPYVYGHTGYDIYKITEQIDQIGATLPDGYSTYIEIAVTGDDYWPLPWYLRKFTNVGYWNDINLEKPAGDIIIYSPDLQDKVMQKLYIVPPPGHKHLYIPLTDTETFLRPGVELKSLIKKDTWDNYYRHTNDEPQ